MPKSISDGGGPSDGQRVGPLLVGVERDGPPILSLPPLSRRPGLVSRTGVAALVAREYVLGCAGN